MIRRISSALLMLPVVLPLVAADAQVRDTAQLKGELAIALLEFEWSSQRPLAFSVGTAGSRFAGLVPAGARILGGTGGTLLIEIRASPDSALAIVGEHLKEQGLRAPEIPERPDVGGFVNAETAPTRGANRFYCRGSDVVFLRARPLWSGWGTVVNLRYNTPYGGSPCTPRNMSAAPMQSGGDDLEAPLLRPPLGSTSMGGGMSSGGSFGGDQYKIARAELASDLSTGDLVAHYAVQLREQGWTVDAAPLSNAEAAMAVARKRDAKGRELVAVLSDARGGSGRHYVSLRIEARAAK